MIPAKPFYLIRHGETEANVAEISAGGEFDSPLTDKGRQQAKIVAERLHHLPIKPDKIIHSSMSRAQDTAHILNTALEIEMHEEHDFREHELGEWSGKPWNDTFPHLLNDVKPKNGENRAEFARRVRGIFTKVLNAHDELLMIVAHGGIFHSLAYMHGNRAEFHVTNCHLHYFEPEPTHDIFPWRVWQFDIEDDGLLKKTAPFCSTQLSSAA